MTGRFITFVRKRGFVATRQNGRNKDHKRLGSLGLGEAMRAYASLPRVKKI